MNAINRLSDISRSPLYWLTYIVGGLSLLVVALIYQYVFEELPCVVCIQIRLWISLLILVAVMGLILRKYFVGNMLSQLAVVFVAAGLIERSYLLLGTEKGFVFADCGFNAGLPAWFAIEQWLPWLFQVEASCGYTPELLFGVTMAEALMVMSVVLAFVSGVVLLTSWVSKK